MSQIKAPTVGLHSWRSIVHPSANIILSRKAIAMHVHCKISQNPDQTDV